jgi:hypothetical protein
MEQDPDGTAYVRVVEQVYDPFAPGVPQRVIANMTIGPGGTNYPVEGPQTTLITNIDEIRMQHGLQLMETGLTSIYDYTYYQFDGGGSIHGAAIKLGDNDRPTNGATYIQRVFADGVQAPDPTFSVSNTDFIGIEFDSGPVYIRDVTGRNFGDAGIDTKSTPVYVMNATLSSANQMLKVWQNTEVWLVNSIVNVPPRFSQAWIYDNTSTIRYYNVLWCEGSSAPSPSDPNCRTTPWLVEGENISPAQALARIIPLTSNPLPGVSPFFATNVERIVIEYSQNGGSTWQPLSIPNTGGGGFGPLGDPRYRIPLNLASADYYFRAWYEQGGVRIGEISLVINEAGQVVP